jgi:hypothetical protein
LTSASEGVKLYKGNGISCWVVPIEYICGLAITVAGITEIVSAQKTTTVKVYALDLYGKTPSQYEPKTFRL